MQYPAHFVLVRLNDDLRRCLNPLNGRHSGARLTIASPPFAGSAKGCNGGALLARQQRPSFRRQPQPVQRISPAGHVCRAVDNFRPVFTTMPNCPRGIYPPLSYIPAKPIPMMENHLMASSLYRLHSPCRLLTRHAFRQFRLCSLFTDMPSFSSNQETPDFRESSGCIPYSALPPVPPRIAAPLPLHLQFGRGRLNGRQQISKPAPQACTLSPIHWNTGLSGSNAALRDLPPL